MHNVGNESISPELVLVDPELAARLRATAVAGPPPVVPDESPPAAQAPVTREPPAEETIAAAPVAEPLRDSRPAHAGRTSRRLRTPRPASIVVGLAVMALLLVGFLPPRQAPRLGEATAPANASPGPITLGWEPQSASAYLVEVFVGKTLVHAASTPRTAIEVPGWLAPGRYTWRVSAYSGPGSGASRPERPFEQGWFVVD